MAGSRRQLRPSKEPTTKTLWIIGYPLRLALFALMWLVLALVDQKELKSSTFHAMRQEWL
jgi:hypothetical protein